MAPFMLIAEPAWNPAPQQALFSPLDPGRQLGGHWSILRTCHVDLRQDLTWSLLECDALLLAKMTAGFKRPRRTAAARLPRAAATEGSALVTYEI